MVVAPMVEIMCRYRATMIAASVLLAVGVWPGFFERLGRAYIEFCARYLTGAPFAHHFPPLLVGFVATIGATFLTLIAIFLIRQIWAQRHLETSLRRHVCSGDERLDRVVRTLGLVGRVRCTDESHVYAFCGGLVGPRIYVSRGLVELLTETELEAVLRHEQHHLIRHDPLRYFASDIIGWLTPFVPVLPALMRRFRINAELDADRAALANTPIEALAGALVKVMRASSGDPSPAVIAQLSPTDARIAALLGRPAVVPVDRRDVAISIGFVAVVLGVMSWLVMQPLPLPPACASCPPF